MFQHRILAHVLGVCLKALDTLLVLEKKYLVRALGQAVSLYSPSESQALAKYEYCYYTYSAQASAFFYSRERGRESLAQVKYV